MIKSSNVSLKFCNSGKLSELEFFMSEYRDVLSAFIDILWDMDVVRPLLDKDITEQVDSWLSARMIQCAGKQASAIVRGTKKKQHKRKWQIDKFNSDGYYKKARKLQDIYDSISVNKPSVSKVNPELDSRFIKIDLDNDTAFDGWITITSIGDKKKLNLPFKRNSHFNKLDIKGILKKGVRLSNDKLTFMFELADVEQKTTGGKIGIDIGKSTVISCSNTHVSKPNKHGHDLNSIIKNMCRKKKGSKAFKRTTTHRKNYINWSINQLNLTNIKEVKLEKIKHLKKNTKSSRMLSHWTYTDIIDKLSNRCIEQGVLVRYINPTYTSQRCSKCGWTRKSNRKGKTFTCTSCSFTADADLNASCNIALELPSIKKEVRLKQPNRIGFYWNVLKQDSIVPVIQKPNS